MFTMPRRRNIMTERLDIRTRQIMTIDLTTITVVSVRQSPQAAQAAHGRTTGQMLMAQAAHGRTTPGTMLTAQSVKMLRA